MDRGLVFADKDAIFLQTLPPAIAFLAGSTDSNCQPRARRIKLPYNFI